MILINMDFTGHSQEESFFSIYSIVISYGKMYKSRAALPDSKESLPLDVVEQLASGSLIMKNLDCRGLACPGPVVQVKKTLQETSPGGSFSVELDSEVSRDNVLRFIKSRGAHVRVEEEDQGSIRMVITSPALEEVPVETHVSVQAGEPVIFISSETIGSGDDKLGRILMEGFLNTLIDQERIPDRIILLNTGVRLAVKGSVVLKSLTRLTDSGCEIMVCTTCLDFYDLKAQLAVGTGSNMYEIQEALLGAGSVIRV